MNESVLTIVIILFTQVIVFLACTFSPYISMRHIFFGVRLSKTARKDEEITRITRTYLLRCSAAFVLSLVITLWYMLNATSEYQIAFASILSVFIQMGLYFAFFVRAHHQIKDFVHTLEMPLEEMTKTVVDTHLMKEKHQLKKHFRRLYLLPLLLIVGTILYTFLNYSALPEIIPTHWNLMGKADRWQVKSPITLGMHSLMQLILLGILFYASDHIFTTRGKLDPDNYEKSKEALMHYLKGMGYSFYVMTLSIILVFTLTTFSMVKGTSLNIGFMVLGLILPLLASVYMFVIWFKYRKNTIAHTSYSPEDEDSRWILGSFYYNPNDPSLFVEKRYGIGWTINLGTLPGKVIMIITFIFIIGSIFLPLILS